MNRPLNKREQKKLAQKKSEAKNKRITTLFYLALFISFCLFLYCFTQYYWTIIDYKIPLAIFIGTGLVLGFFVKKYFENALKSEGIKMPLFWYIFLIASFCTASFFFLNKIFSEDEVYSIKAPIIDTYTTRRKGGLSLYAVVELFDSAKELSYPIEDKERLENSNFIVLTVSKGGFGYEIIRARTLSK